MTAGQPFRTKSLTTKVTEEEYARLQELATAAGQSMGEWARTVLLAQVNSSQEIILAEVLIWSELSIPFIQEILSQFDIDSGSVPSAQHILSTDVNHAA